MIITMEKMIGHDYRIHDRHDASNDDNDNEDDDNDDNILT